MTNITSKTSKETIQGYVDNLNGYTTSNYYVNYYSNLTNGIAEYMDARARLGAIELEEEVEALKEKVSAMESTLSGPAPIEATPLVLKEKVFSRKGDIWKGYEDNYYGAVVSKPVKGKLHGKDVSVVGTCFRPFLSFTFDGGLTFTSYMDYAKEYLPEKYSEIVNGRWSYQGFFQNETRLICSSPDSFSLFNTGNVLGYVNNKWYVYGGNTNVVYITEDFINFQVYGVENCPLMNIFDIDCNNSGYVIYNETEYISSILIGRICLTIPTDKGIYLFDRYKRKVLLLDNDGNLEIVSDLPQISFIERIGIIMNDDLVIFEDYSDNLMVGSISDGFKHWAPLQIPTKLDIDRPMLFPVNDGFYLSEEGTSRARENETYLYFIDGINFTVDGDNCTAVLGEATPIDLDIEVFTQAAYEFGILQLADGTYYFIARSLSSRAGTNVNIFKATKKDLSDMEKIAERMKDDGGIWFYKVDENTAVFVRFKYTGEPNITLIYKGNIYNIPCEYAERVVAVADFDKATNIYFTDGSSPVPIATTRDEIAYVPTTTIEPDTAYSIAIER